MVAHGPLEAIVMVRIHVGQPVTAWRPLPRRGKSFHPPRCLGSPYPTPRCRGLTVGHREEHVLDIVRLVDAFFEFSVQPRSRRAGDSAPYQSQKCGGCSTFAARGLGGRRGWRNGSRGGNRCKAAEGLSSRPMPHSTTLPPSPRLRRTRARSQYVGVGWKRF